MSCHRLLRLVRGEITAAEYCRLVDAEVAAWLAKDESTAVNREKE